MPGTKEIRNKIASVKSTQKITKAMQMVATSKMRRAQERMKLARPYAEKIRAVIGHLNEANPDYRHPFLLEREPRAIGVIVISTDRGLAGGLNANLFKQTLLLLREWQEKGAAVSLCLIGSKGVVFFRRLGLPILANVSGLGDKPHVKDLIGAVKVMLDAYREAKIDRLFLVKPAVREHDDAEAECRAAVAGRDHRCDGLAEHWDYIYEPEAAAILEGLLMRYIESQVYRGRS